MKILLDTNFLLAPAQFKTDIFELLRNDELYTLDLCIKEMEKLAKGKGKNAAAAKVALELLEKNNVKILKTGKKKNADAAIIDTAKAGNYAVATNDKKLIKSLKSYRIKIIRLKQKKQLTYE